VGDYSAEFNSTPYNAVTDVYRNRVPDFDDRLMLNAAGLWNFYLDAA